jgi:bifunctional non-homologous end joining protein LigD
MPTLLHFQPIGFVPRSVPFDSSGWLFEPLYDGRRALLLVRDGECRIEPADDLPLDGLSGLQARMAGLIQAGDAVLDGEVVALDRDGRPLHNPAPGQGFPAFAAFDLLWLDGDLRPLPLARRKEALEALLPWDTGPRSRSSRWRSTDGYLRGRPTAELNGVVALRSAIPTPADCLVQHPEPAQDRSGDGGSLARRNPPSGTGGRGGIAGGALLRWRPGFQV